MSDILKERLKGRLWHIENLIEIEPDAQVILVEEAIAVIDSLQATEWIACSERLPKHNGWYWVLVNSKTHVNAMYLARFHNKKWDKIQGYDNDMSALIHLITDYCPTKPAPPQVSQEQTNE